jgi:hypothetical protein
MGDLITSGDVKSPALLRNPDLADLISAAGGLIEEFCNRTFAYAQDLTEAYDGTDTARIWLKRPPVVTVSSVVLNGQPIDYADGYAWTVNPDTGELRRGPPWGDVRFCARFPRGLQNVVVTYTGGFPQTPPRVKRAAVILVKHLADGSKTTGLYKGETIGPYSYQLNTDDGGLPAVVKRLIEGYVL